MARHIYLAKANDEFISHCRCPRADAVIAAPSQMDCPWCGCGWLFSCNRCRKAFTFAQGVEIEETWEETADRAIRAFFRRDPEPEEVKEWVEFMPLLLEDVRPGGVYVYFDGWVIPATAEGIHIEGWHSRHDLDYVPQVAALRDPEIGESPLSSRDYWQSRAIERGR